MSERLNSTAYVLLGLLSIEPNLSGYDMRKLIQQSVGYFWAESYGQIYPALKRLVAGRLIEETTAKPTGRKRRLTYALTEAGHAELRQWLALPFHNDPPRNEFLLKLFFGREAAPGVSVAHIKDVNDRNQQALATLENIEASIPKDQLANPHFPFWMLSLSLGRALTVAALEWGENALKLLTDQEESAIRPHDRKTTSKTQLKAKRN